MKKFLPFFKSHKGAALVEYGMLVGLIAVLSIVSVIQVGDTVKTTFTEVSDTLSGNMTIALAEGVSGTPSGTPSGTSSGTPSGTPAFSIPASAVAVFDVVVGTNGIWVGYSETGYGAMSNISGHIVRDFMANSSGQLQINISGNIIGQLDNMTLACASPNQTVDVIFDTSSSDFAQGYHTFTSQSLFNWNNRPFFTQVGDTYQCYID